MDAPGMVGGDADDQSGVGMGRQILRGIAVFAALVGGMGRGVTDVEPAAIAGDGLRGVEILDGELSQRLIIL